MKRFLIVTLSLLIIVLGVTGFYINNVLNQIGGETVIIDEQGDPVITPEDKGISPEAPTVKETGIVNILLLGTDRQNANERGRSDSMMIASVDKKNKTIKITSLMRDMYVPIPGKRDNRLNTAYGSGGAALAIKTINTNFNMNIHDYIAVDFFTFETIIDIVDGIPMDIKRAEIRVVNEYIADLNKLSKNTPATPNITNSGLQTLTGRQATAFSRIRFVGRDDFERTERQRRVLNELFIKGKSIGIAKIPELVNTVLPNVETSLSKTDILELAIAMISFTRPEIDQFRIPADGTYKDEWVSSDMLVLKPDIQKNKELLHEFIFGKDKKGE